MMWDTKPAKAGSEKKQVQRKRAGRGAESHAPFTTSPVGTGTWTDLEPRPLGHTRVQRKAMSVRPAGDQYEVEADRVADTVMAALPSQKAGVSGGERGVAAPVIGQISSVVQRDSDASASGGRGARVNDTTSARIEGAKGGGSPLDAETRAFMEPRFGQDFGQVRLHTDGRAGELAGQLQAKAFTHGSDIFMGKGQASTKSPEGRHLLAHELTHVVQQGAAGGALQAKPIIQRDTEPGAKDGGDSAVESAAAPPASAKTSKKAGARFINGYRALIVAIGNDSARKNMGALRAGLAELEGAATESGDPRCRQLIQVTNEAMGAIFASPPLPVEEALTRPEAAQLRAFAKKRKYMASSSAARADVRRTAGALKGEKWYEPSGSRVSLAAKKRKAKKHTAKAASYLREYESLFEGRVPPNIMVTFTNKLSRQAVEQHPALLDLCSELSGAHGVKGSLLGDLANVVQHHVGAHLIEAYERISGEKF